MKATKLIALTVPVLLVFGCGVGDKDSTPKTEETSKAMLKLQYLRNSIQFIFTSNY